MSVKPNPLFIDSGSFFAYFNENDEYHEIANSIFGELRKHGLEFGPLYTSMSVIFEVVDLLLYRVGYDTALTALDSIPDSDSFNILTIDKYIIQEARDVFKKYDDQAISIVDCCSAVLCRENEIEHLYSFDSDFEVLGFELFPA